MEKFLEALSKDEKLMKKFGEQTTSEGLYSVAKPYIGNMTQEEFIEELKRVNDMGKKFESGGELSEDALESVSGGISWNQVKGVWNKVRKPLGKALTWLGNTIQN